jgi:hypothetical protein
MLRRPLARTFPKITKGIRVKTSSSLKSFMAIALAVLLANGAAAQVRTVTLGITTHCPYGVGGCWAEIRNGLNLPGAIAVIPQRPDTKTQTFDLHMLESWAPDPELFARNFKTMNVGVDVRGVEAMVDGVVERDGTNLMLRLNESGTIMRLAPLTRTVRWDTKRNRPEPLTRPERKAFEKLAARFKKEPTRVRVTGPLIQPAASTAKEPAQQILEVRKFEVLRDPA